MANKIPIGLFSSKAEWMRYFQSINKNTKNKKWTNEEMEKINSVLPCHHICSDDNWVVLEDKNFTTDGVARFDVVNMISGEVHRALSYKAIIETRHATRQRHIDQAYRSSIEPLLPQTEKGRDRDHANEGGFNKIKEWDLNLRGEPDVVYDGMMWDLNGNLIPNHYDYCDWHRFTDYNRVKALRDLHKEEAIINIIPRREHIEKTKIDNKNRNNMDG